MSQKASTAGVIAPPPLILLFFLVCGMILDVRYAPLQQLPVVAFLPRAVAGGVLLALAGVLLVVAVGGFRRAGTPVPTGAPTTALVTSGIHALTRNPIYLGFFFLHAGLALLLDSRGMLLTLPLFMLVIRYGVVAREEAYLTDRFGDAYADYCRRVPRWL